MIFIDFWDGKSRLVWMIWDFQNETKHKKLRIWVSPFMESLIVKKWGIFRSSSNNIRCEQGPGSYSVPEEETCFDIPFGKLT